MNITLLFESDSITCPYVQYQYYTSKNAGCKVIVDVLLLQPTNSLLGFRSRLFDQRPGFDSKRLLNRFSKAVYKNYLVFAFVFLFWIYI